MTDNQNIWPSLQLASWQKTKDTLHLYLQIVGKIRLRTMPHWNHWWQVTLYVSSRGMETGAIPYQDFNFNIAFDFMNHQVELSTSNGFKKDFPLINGLSVAQFYARLMELMAEAGIQVKILGTPYKNKSDIPFRLDDEHHTYDADAAHSLWQVLVQTDGILKQFSARFIGKQCPVHLYWHSFDLVNTRFNGRQAPAMNTTDQVELEAYSHEVISFGFWPGDENVPDAAFYSYTYPLPAGIANEPLSPKSAQWIKSNGSDMALLMYEDMRNEPNPGQALMDFLQSTYNAGAKTAGWDRAALDVS